MQSAMGDVKETVGKVTGLEGLRTSGQESRAQGDANYNEAQSQGYTEGLKDRALGKKDQVHGAVSGDTTQEASGTYTHMYHPINARLINRRRPSQRAGKDSAGLESVLNHLTFIRSHETQGQGFVAQLNVPIQ
jgi:uncharacterized protein YjbJ (UPF0337 family)